MKQHRLVKTIRATRVTGVDIRRSDHQLTIDELRLLARVASRNRQEIHLRAAGLSPDQISRLAFLKWLQGNPR